MAFDYQQFTAQTQSFGNVAELMKGLSSSETDKAEGKGFAQDVIFEGEDKREAAKNKYKKLQNFWSNFLKFGTVLLGLPAGVSEGVSLVGSKLIGELSEDKAMEEMGDYKWQKRKTKRMEENFGRYTDENAFQTALDTYLLRETAGDERKWGEWESPKDEGLSTIFKSKTSQADASTVSGAVTETARTDLGGDFPLDAEGNEIISNPINNLTKKADKPVPSASGDIFVKGQLKKNFKSLLEGAISSYDKNIFGEKMTLQELYDKQNNLGVKL